MCPCGQRYNKPSGTNEEESTLPPYLQQTTRQETSNSSVSSSQAPPTAGRTHRVRCPRCSTVTYIPDGANVVDCRCGLHLLAPVTSPVLPATVFSSSTSATQPLKLLLAKSNSLGNLLVSALAVESLNAGNWNRRIAAEDKLGWKRKWTEAEESAVMDEECRVMESFQDGSLETMTIEKIREKLIRCDLTLTGKESKEDLIIRAITAVSELGEFNTTKLRVMLEERGVDHSICGESSDLAARLFAYEWSSGETVKCVRNDAFVRRFKVKPENGETYIEPITATEFFVSTRLGLESPGAPTALTAREVLQVSLFPFKEKQSWFQEQLKKLRVPWDQGHVKLRVKRSSLLQDSYMVFLKLQPMDMRRFFRFEFIDEPGVDAGGVAREWFETVADMCFNVDFGLFEYGGTDSVSYQINPSSGFANELHLQFFRFLGRLIGKALFDGHTINAHLTRVYYKHLLAWPIVEDDIEFIDSEIAKSTKQIRECENAQDLCLDFTMNISVFGENKTIDLKPNGKDIEVTNENRDEYLFLRLQQIALSRVSAQLHEFLVGVYEVVPMGLLSVFDYSELELLLCGLPTISVDDWKANTVYRGVFLDKNGAMHPVIDMFWELMMESNDEQRARFLQFATGTSRVPVTGFGALQGNDGNVKLFTIDALKLEDSVFPKSHTCFNRIDLPLYTSKEEMKFRIGQALAYEGTGFQME